MEKDKLRSMFRSLYRLSFIVTLSFCCLGSARAADEEVDPLLVGEIVHQESGIELSEPVHIDVSGNYAYIVSEESDSLSIIDITDPFAPAYIGGVKDGDGGLDFDRPTSVYVREQYAYITANYSDAFYIFDISDPSTPQLIGSIFDGDESGTVNMRGPFFSLVEGDYAYVLNFISDNIIVFNISDPTTIWKAGEIHDGEFGADTMLNGPVSALIENSRLYVASQDDHAIEIIDIADPTAPRHLGSLSDTRRLRQIRALAYRDGHVYATSRSGRSLQVIDVGDSARPAFIGQILDGEDGALLTDSRSISFTDKYALITSFRSDALEIVNITDLADPYHVMAVSHSDGIMPYERPTSAVYDNKLLYTVLGVEAGKMVIVAPTPKPDISSVPSEHDFGDINVGQSLSQEFVLSNTGYADLELENLDLLSGSDFSISMDGCSGQTLAPRATCSIVVLAEPRSGGEKYDEVGIPNNTETKNPFVISLRAQGLEVAEASYDALVEAIEDLEIRDVTMRFLVMRTRLSERHFEEGRPTPARAIILTIRVNILGLEALGIISEQEADHIVNIIDAIIDELLT